MFQSDRVVYAARSVLLVSLLAVSGAAAQSSSQSVVRVPFASDSAADGYVSAAVNVTYAFLACQGEMHIAYSLNEGSVTAEPSYRLEGQVYPTHAAAPTPSSIRFAGTVYRGPQPVGSFQDGLTGKALGMGCFSGQTQKIGNLVDLVGPKPSSEQVTAYINSLRVEVQPANVLRSVDEESAIRADLRRVEAEAAAARRKAEQEEQLARAQQEAEQRAAAEQQAAVEQQAAEEQQTAASTESVPPMASEPSGTGTDSLPQESTLPLSDEQRIAQAIASDQVLADQRLEEERRRFEAQQQALADQQQQQNEVIVAAAPVLLDAAGGIYGALDAWNTRWINRSYEAAQAALAGQCLLPDGLPAPKDGDIQLGVEFKAKLSKRSCGYNPGNRFMAYKLELPEPAQLQFTIKPAMITTFTSFQIAVLDLDQNSHMLLGWQDWGALQKVNSKAVSLPAGVYIVRVSNGVEGIFASFKLRVDLIAAQ